MTADVIDEADRAFSVSDSIYTLVAAPTAVDCIAPRLIVKAHLGAHDISAYEADARGFDVGGR